MKSGANIDAVVESWLRPDAELDRELDEVFGLTERQAWRVRFVAYLNAHLVPPLFYHGTR